MIQAGAVIVTDKEGQRGTIEPTLNLPSGSKAQVWVQLDNGQQISVPAEMLVLQDDGNYYLPLSIAEFQRQGNSEQDEEAIVIPVVVEELEVQILQEELEVERVPINRPVDGPIPFAI